MRKLLLFFAFVLTAIGVKAYEFDLTKTWTVDGANEKVAKISLDNAGELTTALADLNDQMTDYSHLYISNGAGFNLTTEDIAALGTVTCPTLDLQNLYGAGGGHHAPFTFSNASIKRVILPDYWDKAAVKAAAEKIIDGNTGFEAALSQHGEQNQSTADAGLVAYVQKPGTLYTAMRHTYFDGRADKKMGDATQSHCSFKMLGYVSIMGYPSARDFNGSNSTDVKFDANGHFVFDRPADETSITQNMGVGGVLRTLVGSPVNGALVGASPILLDLEDAIIYDEWNEDLNLSWSYLLGANRIKEVRIPTNPELKTIPADFLNSGGNVNYIEEFCIPGNIEIIRTRAFYSSQQVLRHVSGVVMDENNRPLADVWIGIRGAGAGASTDSTGHFSFWMPRDEKLLYAECLGYVSKRNIPADSSLTIRLRSATVIREVKVIPKSDSLKHYHFLKQ